MVVECSNCYARNRVLAKPAEDGYYRCSICKEPLHVSSSRSWFLKFLMKHGIGSPGSIAKAMVRTYLTIKRQAPSKPEPEVLRDLYMSRAAAVAAAFKTSRSTPLGYTVTDLDSVLSQAPTLFSLIRLVIFYEHPELLGPNVPENSLATLDEVISEVLKDRVLGWG